MPSSDTVPRPAEWPRSTRPAVVAAFAFVAVVLVLVPVALALYYFRNGRQATGGYSLALAVIALLVLWVGYETRFRGHTSTDSIGSRGTDDGRAGLEIPYSASLYRGYGALMTAIALLFATAAGHALTVPGTGYANSGYLFAALAAVFASFPALMATGRFARGRVLLTPEGIHQRGWTFESFLRWQDVVGIYPTYRDCPVVVVRATDNAAWRRRQITRLWRQDRLPGTRRGEREVPMIVIPGKFLSADPVIVYHLLGYYLEHADARAELGTEAAVRRARAAAFG
ncbi:hypothetical protein B0I33_112212 [Prauserella shujinwangii]|uniref:Uncharacterized protein n=1 Tax=Prauserella shujinwangii TaxID=1453103 RepID=A0A2T0LMN4_9PSEU|nr:hypothetical protein [Prauserella shujinwangii]PRX44334.1 hypothetical protein B0I33_112212 [Prauserella shujinwangii]